ncbi:hypothetical protein FIBSPDRAFT_864552 [Athelia psychrophila]|uniref:Uncharacterized protein n=1 Tax=Athelia psychrophila TaxID=1759441 RepID=A0A166GJV1_9AGAM|nr:hypothetical protein FIBSPDRAFT_869953 [Fibularhizoctonia sp. CBS 109695]KZP17911.1 hypothetical protein FIBSPDRAFT_864552 [Fibularhizoctonia sp. CBS 109695]
MGNVQCIMENRRQTMQCDEMDDRTIENRMGGRQNWRVAHDEESQRQMKTKQR